MADGGGKVVAALRILRRPSRIGWLYRCVARRFIGVTYRLIRVNGELGAVAMMDGHVFSVLSFVIDGERISRIYNIRNPDILIGIAVRDLAVRPRVLSQKPAPVRLLSRRPAAVPLHSNEEASQ